MDSEARVAERITEDDGRRLLAMARRALVDELSSDRRGNEAPDPTRAGWGAGTVAIPDELQDRLRRPGACFVTLRDRGELRGCIGSLEATKPLIDDLVDNALSAALRDPRFAPLKAAELERVSIEVSVLSEPESFEVDSEEDLLRRLRPGVDGLILQCGRRRGTFLPAVWKQLPDPAGFVRHLKLKAGLGSGFWSPDVRVWRYTTTSWSES